jgi:hypothetical protein
MIISTAGEKAFRKLCLRRSARQDKYRCGTKYPDSAASATASTSDLPAPRVSTKTVPPIMMQVARKRPGAKANPAAESASCSRDCLRFFPCRATDFSAASCARFRERLSLIRFPGSHAAISFR